MSSLRHHISNSYIATIIVTCPFLFLAADSLAEGVDSFGSAGLVPPCLFDHAPPVPPISPSVAPKHNTCRQRHTAVTSMVNLYKEAW